MNIIWRTEQERIEDARAWEQLNAMGDWIAVFFAVILAVGIYFVIGGR